MNKVPTLETILEEKSRAEEFNNKTELKDKSINEARNTETQWNQSSPENKILAKTETETLLESTISLEDLLMNKTTLEGLLRNQTSLGNPLSNKTTNIEPAKNQSLSEDLLINETTIEQLRLNKTASNLIEKQTEVLLIDEPLILELKTQVTPGPLMDQAAAELPLMDQAPCFPLRPGDVDFQTIDLIAVYRLDWPRVPGVQMVQGSQDLQRAYRIGKEANLTLPLK